MIKIYTNETYEIIKERILSNIDIPITKSEGSFLNNMISPFCVELAKAYIEFNNILDIAFIENSYDKFLDMKVKEFGMERKLGEKAIGNVSFTGTEGSYIPKGTVVKTKGELLFITIDGCVIGANNKGTVDVEASNIGKEYNIIPNLITSIETAINGISSVKNEVGFSGGADKETDEKLKERFFEKVRKPASSGNIQDYINWAKEVDGVSYARVIPVWNGGGTVKVIITDENNRPVDSKIIEVCKEHLEKIRPIGASITVITPNILDIIINVNIEIDKEYSFDSIKNDIENRIKNYIFKKNTKIIYSKIFSIIASEQGVLDCVGLTINGITSNITLDENTLATLKTFNATEVKIHETNK